MCNYVDEKVTYVENCWQKTGLKVTIREGEEMVPQYYFLNYDGFYSKYPLLEVYLPTSMRKIGKAAFCGCTELQRIQLNEGLEEIESKAFKGVSGIKSLKIPKTVKKISRDFNANSSITELIVDGSHVHELGPELLKCPNVFNVVARLSDGSYVRYKKSDGVKQRAIKRVFFHMDGNKEVNDSIEKYNIEEGKWYSALYKNREKEM